MRELRITVVSGHDLHKKKDEKKGGGRSYRPLTSSWSPQCGQWTMRSVYERLLVDYQHLLVDYEGLLVDYGCLLVKDTITDEATWSSML